MSDLSVRATNYLLSLDSQMGNIAGNINGSARNAYKKSNVKNVEGTEQTSIDFSQGTIVASPERNNLAIQGPGFFRLNDKSDGSGKTFYTRDGQFNFDTAGHLTTGNGLYLTDESGNEVTVDLTNHAEDWDLATGVGLSVPSVELVNFDNLQGLEYSSYGSTVFQTDMPISSYINGKNVIYSSLEASNSSITQSVPELSLSQKSYTASAKVVQVANQNVDTILNLIR